MPADSQKTSVGPLTARPPTNGLTATTGAAAAVSACLIPGRARMGPIDATGFEGPMTMTSAPASAASTSGVGPRLVRTSELDGLDRARGALEDHELLEGELAATRLARGSEPARPPSGAPGRYAERVHDRGVGARRTFAPPQQLGAKQAERQVAVAEPEPGVPAGRLERRHHLEAVAAQPVAAFVDRVGQPVGHEVGIRGDVHAVDLHVVAGVGDHGKAIGPGHIEQPTCQLGPAGAA